MAVLAVLEHEGGALDDVAGQVLAFAGAYAAAAGVPLFRQVPSSACEGPNWMRDAGRGDTHGIVIAAACPDGAHPQG